MKIWKRNAIVAAVLVLVCAGIYLNWSHNHPDTAAVDLTETLDAAQVMGDGLVISEPADVLAQEAAAETAENYHVILGRVASGDKFIGTKEGKEHIKKYVQGDCAEMEGAAIAHACWLNRIPFVIIRAISDSADEQANMSYEQFVLLAAKRSSELVEKMLEKLA